MSSSFIKAESISKALLIIPYLWLAIGIIWMSHGNKPLVGMVLIAAVFHIFSFGLSQIKLNVKNNVWLLGTLLATVFSIASYYSYGASSQELRGLLISIVFLCLLPNKPLLNTKFLQYLIFSAALACLALSCWYYFIKPTVKGNWPINLISLATHQGLISVLSMGALLTNFKGKITWLLVSATTLSCFSMILTESRGLILAIIGAYFFVGVILLWKNKISFKIITLSLIICSGVVFFSKDAMVKRYNDTVVELNQIDSGYRDSSIGLRLQMYEAGLKLFESAPILGHGNFSREYIEENISGYTPTAYGFMSQGHLHNNYIDKLARSGIIGLSIFLFLVFYPVYLGSRKCPDFFGCFAYLQFITLWLV